MFIKIINFLSQIHGYKNLLIMMLLTISFALLEIFGLGFFIIIIIEILSPESSLCANPQSFLGYILNQISFCSQNNLVNILLFVTIFFFIKFICQALIIIFKSRFLSFGIYKFIELNIKRIFKIKIDRIEDQNFFQDNNSLIKEADILFNSFFNKFFDCITELLILAILVTFLIYFDNRNLIILLFFVPFVIFYFFSFSKKTKDSGKSRQDSLTNLNQKFYNIFKNRKTIEILNRERLTTNLFLHYLHRYKRSTFYHFSIVYLPRIVLENFLFIIISIGILISIKYTSPEEALSFFTIYGLIFIRLVPSINRIKNSFDTLFFRLNSFNLIYEINHRYKSLSDDFEINTVQVSNIGKELKIDKLNISHKENILINANMIFEKNKFHCIQGPSGSGKSTLLNFLCGFKEADCFSLNEGELNYKKYIKILNIGYLSQKIFFEDTSLIENLLMGEKKNDENKQKIIEMMKSLNLEGFIDDLDKKVSFDGNNFSLGEQQRFLIIRSMIKKPEILILDEPFSALDDKNQNILVNFLMEYKNKLTLIMSTHVNYSNKLFDYRYEIINNQIRKVN